ncbi:aerobic C4-dicarboxylate transport protein [Opitutus sp. GAS368]|jgi:aerobic C4-dicarboxylate transport protein|nr:C4-dicarboxylate transporter DctA [Opitutus sp. GAS368]SDR68084.1 aerobic C4-dicarboxylate transport protein [Opitutus sp. GAS368]
MKYLRHLYIQVLIAVVLGGVCGQFWPGFGAGLKPVADAFVRLVTMLISPIIFCTIVVGIGSMSDLKKVGRVGLKALVYFEVVTTLALLIGLAVVNWVQPGAGIHANAAALDAGAVSTYLNPAKKIGLVDYLLNIIPGTLPGALTSGEILQVLLVAILCGAALVQMGTKGRRVTELLEDTFKMLMRVVGFIVKLAPLAAFAAVAFTVGKFGLHSLAGLASLMACVYLTMAVFIIVVLGAILRLSGLGLWRFLRYLREELFLVIGTSSSETALPGLIAKMENLGCSKPVVGLVVPAGYSFNLDGTSIYLTMAAVFIAQATDTPLSLGQQLGMLMVLLLTSKGAAAVTGGGFITLSATLASTQIVPVAGLTLILGIDRFMSQARALTNLIGNAVAVVTIATWEKEFDQKRAQKVLAGEPLEIGSGDLI